MSRNFKATRARAFAVALGAAAACGLATSPASLASYTPPAGAPLTGANCQSSDGKISGRGSTLQLWLQYQLMQGYEADICGSVAPDPTANGGDETDPGAALYTLTADPGNGTTYQENWMTQYNNTSAQSIGPNGAGAAIGSGAGQAVAACFSDSFGGTDIPITSAQLSDVDNDTAITGGYTGSGTGLEFNGKDCTPPGLTQEFTPQPSTNADYPNPGDTASNSPSGLMVFPIGVSAVSTFANLPTGCVPTGGLHLSNSDMEKIWGGSITNWDQITDAGLTGSCAVAPGLTLARVVRSDNSGTDQGFVNYLADVDNDGSDGICNGSGTTASWEAIQNNEVVNNTNAKNWPTGSSCSALVDSQPSGGPALIAEVETTSGYIGYADLADVLNDTNGFKSTITGNTIAEFNVQASNSATNFQSPRTSANASNCSPSITAPNSGSANGAVGLAGGGWDLTAETHPNQGPDDIGYAKEGSAYPICTLTWDFVWSGEDGNGTDGGSAAGPPPAPFNLNAVSAGATTIPLDSSTIAGVPNSYTSPSTVLNSTQPGQITVPATGGTDVISYTGFNATTDTLTGVSGVTFPIPAETMFNYPNGTGGPEANLTADQRRTLYDYFIYVLSPAGQSLDAAAGYTPLPSVLAASARSGFQANF